MAIIKNLVLSIFATHTFGAPLSLRPFPGLFPGSTRTFPGFPYFPIHPTYRPIQPEFSCKTMVTTNQTFHSDTTSENGITPIRIIMVVDETGSMSQMRDSTIESYNGFIDSQISSDIESESEKPQVSLVKFATDFSIRTWENIEDSFKLGKNSDEKTIKYSPAGGTALYDTLGCILDSYQHEGENILVVITDGEDTSSRKFEAKDIKKRIEKLQETKNWIVNYIGANQDPFEVSESLGINVNNAVGYVNSAKGIGNMYADLGSQLNSFRESQAIMRNKN